MTIYHSSTGNIIPASGVERNNGKQMGENLVCRRIRESPLRQSKYIYSEGTRIQTDGVDATSGV